MKFEVKSYTSLIYTSITSYKLSCKPLNGNLKIQTGHWTVFNFYFDSERREWFPYPVITKPLYPFEGPWQRWADIPILWSLTGNLTNWLPPSGVFEVIPQLPPFVELKCLSLLTRWRVKRRPRRRNRERWAATQRARRDPTQRKTARQRATPHPVRLPTRRKLLTKLHKLHTHNYFMFFLLSFLFLLYL